MLKKCKGLSEEDRKLAWEEYERERNTEMRIHKVLTNAGMEDNPNGIPGIFNPAASGLNNFNLHDDIGIVRATTEHDAMIVRMTKHLEAQMADQSHIFQLQQQHQQQHYQNQHHHLGGHTSKSKKKQKQSRINLQPHHYGYPTNAPPQPPNHIATVNPIRAMIQNNISPQQDPRGIPSNLNLPITQPGQNPNGAYLGPSMNMNFNFPSSHLIDQHRKQINHQTYAPNQPIPNRTPINRLWQNPDQ
jgi:hypothetical protein